MDAKLPRKASVASNPRLLKDTAGLVKKWGANPTFKQKFKLYLENVPGATYKNRPLKEYVATIAAFSPEYGFYENRVRNDQKELGDLLDNLSKDKLQLGEFQEKINSALKDASPTPTRLLQTEPPQIALQEPPPTVRSSPPQQSQQHVGQSAPPATEPVQQKTPQETTQATASQPAEREVKPVEKPFIPEEVKYVEKTHPVPVKPEEAKKPEQPGKPPMPTERIQPVPEPIIQPAEVPQAPAPTLPTVPQEAKPPAPIQVAPVPPSLREAKTTPAEPEPEITSRARKTYIVDPFTKKEYATISGGSSPAAAAIRQRPIPAPPAKLPNLRSIRLPEPVQKWAKDAASLGKQFAIRHSNTLISSGVGGVVGGAVGLATGNPTTGLLGAGAGAALPQLLRTGAAPSLISGAGGVVKIAGAANPVGLAITAAGSPTIRKLAMYAVIGVLGALFGLPILMKMITTGALFPPYDVAYSAPLPTPPGGSPPPGGDIIGYTIPIRNKDVVPNDVKSLVKSSWPNSKLEFWNDIIQWSRENGWNPAFVLTLWIEESGAQHYQEGVDPIGCTLNTSVTDPRQKLNLSLVCLNNFLATHFSSGYNDSMFPQFMCIYSEGHYPCVFNRNNFPGAIKDWYQKVAGSSSIITPTPALPPPPAYAASCPVLSGVISCGSSKGTDTISPCHCTSSYSPSCPPESRRGKAIDIASPGGSKDGDPIYMPTIKGKTLRWYFKGDYDDGYGATLRVFQSEQTPEGIWTIHFVHSKRRDPKSSDPAAIPVFLRGQEISNLSQPVAYMDQRSGVEGSVSVHTHVSVGLIGDDWESGNLQYLNPGWKYADTEMSMCLQ